MNAAPGRFTALVLAGSRGPADPVARHAGLAHKAMVPVAGLPMLARVVRTLHHAPSIGRVALCLDPAATLDGLPELGEALRAGRLILTPAGETPSESVRRAVEVLSQPWPLLITTADHPLLTVEMVEHFCAAAAATRGVDVAVAVAAAATVRAAYPDAVRTFYRFADDGYSGCNLFGFMGPAAERAAVFWSVMERHRKRPWRLIAAVGPVTLLRFLLGRLSLDAALAALSRRVGARIAPVVMPFAEAAIDVDKPADLALAEAILRRRAGA